MRNLKITPQNLLEKLPQLGPWSIYGLAETALRHYFPEEYDEDGYCEIQREVELMELMGFELWIDVVKKYHNEIGYDLRQLSNTGAVNEA